MRRRCPLCNSTAMNPHPVSNVLVWCAGCAETLFRHELVRWATRRTQRRYLRNNPEAVLR